MMSEMTTMMRTIILSLPSLLHLSSVNYEAPASLTIILQREAYLTLRLMFLNLQSDLIKHVWNKFH
jgi:hypothetical protein